MSTPQDKAAAKKAEMEAKKAQMEQAKEAKRLEMEQAKEAKRLEMEQAKEAKRLEMEQAKEAKRLEMEQKKVERAAEMALAKEAKQAEAAEKKAAMNAKKADDKTKAQLEKAHKLFEKTRGQCEKTADGKAGNVAELLKHFEVLSEIFEHGQELDDQLEVDKKEFEAFRTVLFEKILATSAEKLSEKDCSEAEKCLDEADTLCDRLEENRLAVLACLHAADAVVQELGSSDWTCRAESYKALLNKSASDAAKSTLTTTRSDRVNDMIVARVGGLVQVEIPLFPRFSPSITTQSAVFDFLEKLDQIGKRVNLQLRAVRRVGESNVFAAEDGKLLDRIDSIIKMAKPDMVLKSLIKHDPGNAYAKSWNLVLEGLPKIFEALRTTWTRALSVKQAYNWMQFEVSSLQNIFDEAKSASERLGTVRCDARALEDYRIHAHLGRSANVLQFSVEEDCMLHTLFLSLAEKWVPALVAQINKWEAEFGGDLLSQEPRATLQNLRSSSLRQHAIFCVQQVVNLAASLKEKEKEKKEAYVAHVLALDRFPKARKYCWERVKAVDEVMRHHERWNPSILDAAMPELFHNPPNGAPFDEVEADLVDPTYLKPFADQSLKHPERRGETEHVLWNDFRKSLAGKVVFSKSPIPRDVTDGSAFGSSFAFADQVFARALWPTALSAIPLGRAADGSLIYPPENFERSHHVEVVIQARIDNKPVERWDQDCFSWVVVRNNHVKPGDLSDQWNCSQTMSAVLVSHPCQDPFSEIGTASQRLMKALVQSGPGKHTVDLSFHYRVVPFASTIAIRSHGASNAHALFPWKMTEISFPIAEGSFAIDVPAGAKIPNLFPVRQCNMGNAGEMEACILEHYKNSGEFGQRINKTEVPILVSVEGTFFVVQNETVQVTGNGGVILLEKRPSVWGIKHNALFYRSPTTGWPTEFVAIFNRIGMSQPGIGNEPAIPPCHGTTWSNQSPNQFIDLDLLSEEEVSLIKRCPEEMRNRKIY